MPEPSKWDQLDALFEQALDLEPDQREAFLASLTNPAWRADLARLLEEVQPDEDFLEEEAIQFAAPLVVGMEEENALDGERIGPYRLLERVGEGGMGVVYRAEREDGLFEQTVALKVIKRGMDSEAIVRRFQRERQVLAALNHAHIARLLDGGSTTDGRPYFVMEYVEGDPLLTYCDNQKLTIDQRLDLFIHVCDAVQHAHQNLVVHRDLKPSNVLVTHAGNVKLLDFGIAKVLSEDLAEEDLTQTGMRVMTPAYASPEQLQGEAITTASDVYALGVLLYEVLSGQHPHPDRKALDTERQTPARPSTVLTTADHAADTTIGVSRGTTVERLRKRLQGDLDRICLMALRVEPDRRYQTVEHFAEDIRRHLKGLPVVAQPDTWGYRMSKFTRRHRFGVGTTVVSLLVLVVFSLAMVQQRNVAQAEADKANAVKNFLSSIFMQADPSVSLGDTLRVLTILNNGADRVVDEMATQPEIQAELMDIMGVMYWKLGQYERADSLLTQALVLREERGTEAHLRAASLDHLAVLRDAQGRLPEADSLYQEAIRLWRTMTESHAFELSASLNNLTLVYWRQNQIDNALDVVQEALVIRETLYGKRHPEYLTALNNYALLLESKGRYEEAASIHQELLDLRLELFGDVHPDINTSQNNLGVVLWRLGRYDEAEVHLRDALEMARALFGEAHPRVAIRLNTLGLVLKYKDELEEAEQLYREALAMNQKLLGEVHPEVANNMNNIAALLVAMGRNEEALPLYESALVLWEQIYGANHPRVANALSGVGSQLRRLGDYPAAVERLQRAITIREEQLGKTNALVGLAKVLLGATYRDMEQYIHADSAYTQALRIYRGAYPEGHLRIAQAQVGYTRLLIARGHLDKAEQAIEEALLFLQDRYPDGHVDIDMLRFNQGRIRLEQRAYAEAEALLLETYSAVSGIKDERVKQMARETMVNLYEAWGQPEKAATYR